MQSEGDILPNQPRKRDRLVNRLTGYYHSHPFARSIATTAKTAAITTAKSSIAATVVLSRII